ncbi:MAG: hypothetical protein V3U26_03815 [Dehalococcoidia bacterium]
MLSIAGVRFQRAGRVHYFDVGGLEVTVNDFVVAELDEDERVGRVVIAPDQLVIVQLRDPIPTIVRKATPEDLERSDERGVRP